MTAAIRSGSGTERYAALRVEQVELGERDREGVRGAEIELFLDRELGDDLGVSELEVDELFVAEILDDLDGGIERGTVCARSPVRELDVLRPEPDEPAAATDVPQRARRQDVHGRRADERRDERVCGRRVDVHWR